MFSQSINLLFIAYLKPIAISKKLLPVYFINHHLYEGIFHLKKKVDESVSEICSCCIIVLHRIYSCIEFCGLSPCLAYFPAFIVNF